MEPHPVAIVWSRRIVLNNDKQTLEYLVDESQPTLLADDYILFGPHAVLALSLVAHLHMTLVRLQHFLYVFVTEEVDVELGLKLQVEPGCDFFKFNQISFHEIDLLLNLSKIIVLWLAYPFLQVSAVLPTSVFAGRLQVLEVSLLVNFFIVDVSGQ